MSGQIPCWSSQRPLRFSSVSENGTCFLAARFRAVSKGSLNGECSSKAEYFSGGFITAGNGLAKPGKFIVGKVVFSKVDLDGGKANVVRGVVTVVIQPV